MIWLAIWILLVLVTGLVNLVLQTPELTEVVTPLNVALVFAIVGLIGVPSGWPARH